MIRLLRGISVAALVLAAALFAFATVQEHINEDDTWPTITVDSDTIEVPCDYTVDQLLAGVTAWDEKDGDLTSQILVGNFTRFIDPGVCDLGYVVFDSSEHMATLMRRVHFTDYRSPRFALAEPLVFAESTTNNTEVRDLFSATDMLDGDLTDWVTYVGTNASYITPGDYTIEMKVSNSFGDTVSYNFPIHIYERNTQNVEISLTTPLVYLEQGAAFDPLQYVESISDNGGNTYGLESLQINSTVDPSTPGIYEVHYQIGENPADSGSQTNSGNYGQMWLTVIVQGVVE